MNNKSIQFTKLIISILVAQAAGLIGALFTTPNINPWYTGLVKPALNPPSWIFAPVWTTLYVMMGVALHFAWSRHAEKRRRTLWIRLFLAQLVVNALWSFVFFGQHLLLPALGVIVLLWVMILTLIVLARRFDVHVAYLLIPYLAWVSFASYLNFAIWSLNP